MTADSNMAQQNEDECPPATKNPARQPNPAGKPADCKDLEWPKKPDYTDPEKCKSKDCDCPTKPDEEHTCFETLIETQAATIAKADKAKVFKTDLEALYGKAKTARQDYTPEKYKKLLKQWREEDVAIAELVRKLACALPCWKCVIECYICPLFNELHFWEQSIYGDGTPFTKARDLQDLLYWHTRDKETKERTFNRVKAILAAWEKPAATIEKALADNQALIDAAGKVLGTDPGKAVYDVFLRLIPLHLAIAPPVDPNDAKATTTRIDKDYTDFCTCANKPPDADACCGPDIGKAEWTLRDRLVGPQPYLVNPNDYMKIVCCLVEHRYAQAKDALAEADAKVLELDAKVKKFKAQIESGLKSFEKDAKAAIPAGIDCCDYKKKESTTTTAS